MIKVKLPKNYQKTLKECSLREDRRGKFVNRGSSEENIDGCCVRHNY